jgi:hypothetical protein
MMASGAVGRLAAKSLVAATSLSDIVSLLIGLHCFHER